MAFLEKFPKNPSSHEILLELQKFLGSRVERPLQALQSSSKGIKGKIKGQQNTAAAPEELTKIEMTQLGMWLLRHLPVARDAVFEFIATTYNDFVKNYLAQAHGNTVDIPEEEMQRLDDIHQAFVVFLEANGEVWAPILSQWTLQLLGQLSKEYSNRLAFAHSKGVNEIIQVWMGSKAIQSLLDLTSRCLTCRDHANADTFISALLDTSANHSPHFDWVVAHVGNSYPQTVVSQVLNLGLQNFSANPPMVSKISSVGGILEHLVTTHSKEVQHAFDQTLQNGLSDNSLMAEKEKLSVPYLLSMCSNSVPLLDVLMDSILPRVKQETLQKLRFLVPKWVQLHFGGREMALVALVTHLIMKSSRGPKALEILMTGCKLWSNPIALYARKLLDHLIAEVSSMVYEADSTRKDLATNFPCFSAMKDNSSVIINFLTDNDKQVCRTAKQFVKILSLYDGPAVGVKAVCHYLRESKEDKHLWHMVDLVGMLEMKYSNVLRDCLQILAIRGEFELEQSSSDKQKKEPNSKLSKDDLNLQKWYNILKLVKSENLRDKIPIKYKLSTVLQENLIALTPLFDVRKMGFSMKEASVVIEILARLPNLTKNSTFGTLLSVQRHLIEYLFKVLSINGQNHSEKVRNVCHISKLVHELSEDPAIQNDALRTLVEYSLYPESKQLFMARVIGNPKLSYSAFDYDCIDVNEHDEFQPEKFSMYVSLMKENQTRSSTFSVTGSHATSFHSGRLLKNGVKNWSALPKVVIRENEDAYLNFELFLSVLLNVCMAVPPHSNGDEFYDLPVHPKDKGQVVSVEAMRKVALLLVEIVSPDVMFNGLPWPEEEFSKVQVERDLQIKRAFEDHPYLWDLLELVANHCPSLCYCSVLLRALMATLMAHWTSCQEAPAKGSPNQLEWTIRLLQIMRTGQLLPPPLCYIGQVVHELRSHEVLGLLKDIWNYMKISVPVPTIFIKDVGLKKYVRNPEYSKVDVVFTERLRLVMLNNIEKLGYLYPKLFPYQNLVNLES